MNSKRLSTTICGVGMSLAMSALVSIPAAAQQATVEGLIIGRNGPTMSVKTNDTPRLTVVLSDNTKAEEKGGFLGMGKKNLGVAELVPGLAVKVEGSYDPDHKLVAKKVVFSRGSMRTARQIDAGLNPVNEQVAAAQDQLRTHQKNIEQAQQDITKNSQDIETANQGITANTAANAENKTAIGAANQRFTKLDEYDTKDTLTVNFANGKTVVTPKYRKELTEFVKKAADTPGMMIQVQGFASKNGSAEMNQRLSAERAEAVIAIIQQSGAVPLTRILAPAAMGTSNEVANNHTRTGRAQNRRVVVTVLVNKGITDANATTASVTQ